MLIEQTLDKVHAMKLGAMAEAVQHQLRAGEAATLSFEERLGLLVDTEWTAREQRKLTRRLQAAKLRYAASLEAVDFTHPRRLHRQQVLTLAISEFPKGRKYLISLSFRGKASVRPAQVGGFDVNIVIHGSTAVRGRGDLVAYRWALWKLTAPWTHRTRPPHLGKRCAFSTSSTGPFPSNHSRKTPKGPKIALGNPDRPDLFRGVPEHDAQAQDGHVLPPPELGRLVHDPAAPPTRRAATAVLVRLDRQVELRVAMHQPKVRDLQTLQT